ncbi:MAG: hypothetical protein AUJ20_13915 [Comamonadaceae bacterium CG1_02_60_18]|nr:MAG: hypothetical protein AUJ20_13915 [Comamonadaceae bacterium CG1_02_60_18]
MRNDTGFGWQTLIKSAAPQGCALAGALLTTYDRAEARLLSETLLPEWLALSHMQGDADALEQASFSLELDARLKNLHNRIVVVSSTLREDHVEAQGAAADDGLYPWIWRSIRQRTVGKTGQAVQHAKLWLLHWEQPKNENKDQDKQNQEYLEIVVSSANLTRAAFKDQIQAAWRVCVPLQPKPSKARSSAWGVLPAFVRALADSCGDATQLDRFIDLLARAECPAGVSFIASVPGKHPLRSQWGAAGLRSATPSGRGAVKVSILSPFVGAWRSDSLEQWCARFEGTPAHLSLAWIGKNHPWEPNWLLPAATLTELAAAGCTLLQLTLEPGNDQLSHHFNSEHHSKDGRWSHAKLYAFQRGNSRRLLLTSANFSQAAWGKRATNGGLSIDNFELGVCIEQAAWPLGQLTAFATLENLATRNVKLIRSRCLIPWAEASWDGKHIRLGCKCQSALTGEVFSRKAPLKIARWQSGSGALLSAQIAWTDTKNLPQSVALHCETETLNVPIFDTREPAAREQSFPEEITQADVQALSDQLLLERYGGKAVTEDETDAATNFDRAVTDDDEALGDDGTLGQKQDIPGDAALADSYAVASFVLARQMLDIVDNWAKLVTQARQGSSAFMLDGLRRDGNLLMAAFMRKASAENGMGARLAAEELALRLKHWDQ